MFQQQLFSPTNYCWTWTPDNGYSWDKAAACKEALRARNAEASRLKKEGWQVKGFTLTGQRTSKGGIGSGHPHIVVTSTCYVLDARRDA